MRQSDKSRGNESGDACRRKKYHRHERFRPSSPSTIGWSLVVLASFGDAFSREAAFRLPRAPLRATAAINNGFSRKILRKRTSGVPKARTTTDIFYRDSDDEEDYERRTEHDAAAARAAASLAGDSGEKCRNNWWGFKLDPPQLGGATTENKDDEQQYVLDDYLEFVDRRYNRLRGDERGDGEGCGINTAWNWLMKDKPSSKTDSVRKQQDALCVLGLAELASARLLQKHHLPIPENYKENASTTAAIIIDESIHDSYQTSSIDVKADIVPSCEVESDQLVAEKRSSKDKEFASALAVGTGISLLQRLRSQRAALCSIQSYVKILKAVLTGAKVLCRIATQSFSKMILSTSKKQMQMAVTLAASFALFLRPLGKAALKKLVLEG